LIQHENPVFSLADLDERTRAVFSSSFLFFGHDATSKFTEGRPSERAATKTPKHCVFGPAGPDVEPHQATHRNVMDPIMRFGDFLNRSCAKAIR
jgi:hypothetical protein